MGRYRIRAGCLDMIDAKPIRLRRAEMILHVQYNDLRCDYVDANSLDRFLAGKIIRQFYRPSEKRWVNVSFEPISGIGGRYLEVNR